MNAQINGSTRRRQEPATPPCRPQPVRRLRRPHRAGRRDRPCRRHPHRTYRPQRIRQINHTQISLRRLRPLAGTVIVEGAELASLRERDLARTLAVHDTSRPSPELLTCRDVVEAGRFPHTGALAPSRTLTAMRSKRRLRSAILKIFPNGISQPLATGSGSAR